MTQSIRSNFDLLRSYEVQLWRLGAVAERYFAEDPNDEPASALLARIASSNTAVTGKNKRKVPVAPKKRAQAAINL